MSSDSRFVRLLGRFWAVLDGTRRAVLNLLFLLVLAVLAYLLLGGRGAGIGEKTALVLDLRGPIVEQRAGDARSSLLGALSGDSQPQTPLRDILFALDRAADDDKITGVVLALDDFGGAGLATLREVGAALTRFKASGKPVVAWAGRYDQRAYYVAAHADQVLLHPMGAVLIEGYGRYRNYYRDALDRLGVSANVLRAGAYKSFGEPYFASAPSKETLEAEGLLYGGLWKTYTDGIEAARKLPEGSIARGIEELPQRFVAAGGNAAQLALREKLVDALKTRDEMRQMMIERGAEDPESKSFRQVGLPQYVAARRTVRAGDAIGVVIAEGEIVEGAAPAGTVGGRSTAELIRKARDDERIKAVVLRVNSPGGSAYGSELVRRELELTRNAGKPVVVSMGDLAASGGYWISMAADEVIADPATVTGSIGVVAMLPTAGQAMEKLSVHTGGSATTWLVGAYDPRRSLDPRFAELVQGAINHVYLDFTTKAAQARKTTQPRIDAVAQGRVWTGAQARERGLVDALGGLRDALKAAASRAKLGDEPAVRYIEREPGPFAWVLDLLGSRASAWLTREIDSQLGATGLATAAGREMRRELGWLAEVARSPQPFAAIVHCLCEAP